MIMSKLFFVNGKTSAHKSLVQASSNTLMH